MGSQNRRSSLEPAQNAANDQLGRKAEAASVVQLLLCSVHVCELPNNKSNKNARPAFCSKASWQGLGGESDMRLGRTSTNADDASLSVFGKHYSVYE